MGAGNAVALRRLDSIKPTLVLLCVFWQRFRELLRLLHAAWHVTK